MKITMKNGTVIDCDSSEIKNLVPFLKGKIKETASSTELPPKKHKKHQIWRPWTGEELNIIANNLALKQREVSSKLPLRTTGAVGNIMWAMRNGRLDKGKQRTLDNYKLTEPQF